MMMSAAWVMMIVSSLGLAWMVHSETFVCNDLLSGSKPFLLPRNHLCKLLVRVASYTMKESHAVPGHVSNYMTPKGKLNNY